MVRGMPTRPRLLATAAALALSAACGDHGPSRADDDLGQGAESEPGAEETPGLDDAIPSGATPLQVLELKAKKYANGFVTEGKPIEGTLVAGGRSDHLTVLRGAHCYRVIGVGGDGVEDLDLFLYDPDGVQVQQDPGQDRFPTLGMQAELCPPRGGAYRLQIHMYKGEGAFAVGVYATP
jgi:hypothetical protein